MEKEQTQDTRSGQHGGLKAWVTALAVAGVLLAALVYTSLLMQPKSNTSIFGNFDPAVSGVQAEPQDSIDVLVVGDSLALNGYFPHVIWHDYGHTSYVLSTLAQKLPDGNTSLHLALRNQHPTVVLFEVQPLFEGTTFDDALMGKASRVFPVLRYHSRWRQLSPVDFTLKQQEYMHKYRHGAHPEHAVVPVDEQTLAAWLAPTEQCAEIDAFSGWYFAQMLDYARAAGATPVLISIPCPSSWDMAHHNAMTAWAQEHGVDYYDFNLATDELGIDWSTDSKDGGEHLNVNGANKLSDHIGQLLTETYGVTDHRGDASYAQWDTDYEQIMS